MIFADVDPTINPFNEWLKNYGVWISFAMAGVVFLVVLVLFIIALIKRRKNPTMMVSKTVTSSETNNIIAAIGGIENVKAHSLNGSRIVLVLSDYSLVNKEELNKNGIDSVIMMSNKITLVCKSDSSKIYKGMFN